MTDAQPDEALRRVVRRIDPHARLLRARPLRGGVSAEVSALDVARADGSTARWVLRRHGAANRAANPRAARDEDGLVRVARAHGLPVPEPIGYDEAGDLLPTPYVVVAFVEGSPSPPLDLPDYLARAAVALARIHAVRDSVELSFLPRQGRRCGERPARLDDSLGEGRIRDALEAVGAPSRPNPPALLHGDFWPGNLLWRDGEIAAVIDWEDARVGDPLEDLGNSRLEFLWAFDEDAMDGFTDRYSALTGIDAADLPYWDLRAALRPCGRLLGWGLAPAAERRMRALHHRFVAHALDRLPVRSPASTR